MSDMVTIVLFGWIPAILVIFLVLPPRRAVLVSFLFAWMFLPSAGYDIPGFPDYTKVSATNVGALLAAAVFDPVRLFSFNPRLLDVPMLIWCLCPFASSLSNGLGVYDGFSAVAEHLIMWGAPYYIGRVYFTDFRALKELAVFLVVGGLIYVPFCLWEIRMSPNLAWYIYGLPGSGIEYAGEFGKWGSRPRVFMGTGLAVGMFMTVASLVGMWLWTTRNLRRLWLFSGGSLVALLVLVTIGCKNMAALSLLVFGLLVLFSARRARTALPVYLLLLAAPAYTLLRASGTWSGEPLVSASSRVHSRRGESLQFRLENEDILIEKALERPVFGWGRWGRARVYAEDDTDLSVTDGLWIIALGSTGTVGLAAMLSAHLAPLLMFVRRYPVQLWHDRTLAPTAVLAVVAGLYSIDNLLNHMFNPLFIIAAGGILGVIAAQPRSLYGGAASCPHATEVGVCCAR
ncbi:MAG: O-antigen ligase domain-containing protein [Planctomycetota bacterium]